MTQQDANVDILHFGAIHVFETIVDTRRKHMLHTMPFNSLITFSFTILVVRIFHGTAGNNGLIGGEAEKEEIRNKPLINWTLIYLKYNNKQIQYYFCPIILKSRSNLSKMQEIFLFFLNFMGDTKKDFFWHSVIARKFYFLDYRTPFNYKNLFLSILISLLGNFQTFPTTKTITKY